MGFLEPTFIIWAAAGLLGGAFCCLIRAMSSAPVSWADLFAEKIGSDPHPARLLLLASTLIGGSAALLNQLNGVPAAEGGAIGLGTTSAASVSSGFYLLSRLSGGNIWSLFQPSTDDRPRDTR